MRLLFAALLLLCLPAHAQVVTCADATQQGKAFSACLTTVISNAPKASDEVLWCKSGAVAGTAQASCPLATWIPWGQLQGSWILTSYAGWQVNTNVTFATGGGPPCFPKVTYPGRYVLGVVPTAVSARADTYVIYVCELPTGYVTVGWIFNLSEVALTAANVIAGRQSTPPAGTCNGCFTLTPTELAFLKSMEAASGAKALVSFNAASLTRSVFAANTDGTLNPVPIAGSSVAVAAPCNPSKRLPGTPYYSVDGVADSAQSGRTLSNLYALCVVTLPTGSN